jgi:hypothetical protein
MNSNKQTSSVSDGLTESLKSKLNNPAVSPDFEICVAAVGPIMPMAISRRAQ